MAGFGYYLNLALDPKAIPTSRIPGITRRHIGRMPIGRFPNMTPTSTFSLGLVSIRDALGGQQRGGTTITEPISNISMLSAERSYTISGTARKSR